MPDPVIVPDPPPLAVSPTGQAIIPPAAVKWVAPLVTLAVAVTMAPDMGIVLPAVALSIAKLVVLAGTLFGIVSPGARK
jgi:hypothetical protein